MAIVRLNHAVLYVRDLARSVAFYTQVLGFRTIPEMSVFSGAAFLRARDSENDHDLGLFEVGGPAEARPRQARPGLYHLAWQVDTLTELEGFQASLARADALVGASDHGTTKSLYGRDPDGLEFEIMWIVPAPLRRQAAQEIGGGIRHLDIAQEQERYGAQTDTARVSVAT